MINLLRNLFCSSLGRKYVMAATGAGPAVQDMVHDLVEHHVAVTSTLAILEPSIANRPPLAFENEVLKALTPDAVRSYLTRRARIAEQGGDPKSSKSK